MLNMCIPIPSRLPPDLIRSPETLITGSCNDSPIITSPSPAGEEEEQQLEPERDSGDRDAEKVLEEQDSKVLEEESALDAAGEAQKVSGGVGESGLFVSEVVGDDGAASPSFSPFRARNPRKYSKPAARQTLCDPFSSRYSSDFDDLGLHSSSDFDEDFSDTGLHMHALSSRPPPPPPPPVGAGLGNMGNTCFLNAVMQCFTHTVPLVLGLSSYDCEFPRHHNDGEFCVLSAVRDHVFHALKASGDVIFPENLVNNLSRILHYLLLSQLCCIIVCFFVLLCCDFYIHHNCRFPGQLLMEVNRMFRPL